MAITLITYATEGPGDTTDFVKNLSSFDPAKIHRIAILTKTEGNAEENDFSRELALLATTNALERLGGQQLVAKATSLFSTGCEGAYTPFGYLFVDTEEPPVRGRQRGARPTLAMGVGRSRALRAREVGTRGHVRLVADTVRAAMKDAGLALNQVGLVIVKTPVMAHLTAAQGEEAERKSHQLARVEGRRWPRRRHRAWRDLTPASDRRQGRY